MGSLKQRCQERKCKKANFGSQDQEARPVPVVKLRQSKQSLEKPGRKWSGFFQQVEKLSMENYKSQEEVNKSLNPVELLKVDKILDDVIMSFRIECGVEQSVGSKLIHKVDNEDDNSFPLPYSLLVTLPGEEDKSNKDI